MDQDNNNATVQDSGVVPEPEESRYFRSDIFEANSEADADADNLSIASALSNSNAVADINSTATANSVTDAEADIRVHERE